MLEKMFEKIRSSLGITSLISVFLFTSACFDTEDLAKVDSWNNAVAPSSHAGLPTMGSILHSSPGNHAGNIFATVGDVNGDGFDDILLGDPDYWLPGTDIEAIMSVPCSSAQAPCNQGNPGGAFLIYGNASGVPATSDLQDADAIFVGEVSETRAGIDVSGAGDVNADGFADFLVVATGYEGSYMMDADTKPQIWRGDFPAKAYLHYGSANRFSAQNELGDADTQFVVQEPHRTISQAMGVKDMNGDGFDEVALVVAFSHNYPTSLENIAASVHLYWGKANGLAPILTPEQADLIIEPDGLATMSGYINLHLKASPLGDINNDGFFDLAIAQRTTVAPSAVANEFDKINEAYIVFGGDTLPAGTKSLLAVASVRIAPTNDTLMGSLVSNVGDLNNDQFDDFAISDAHYWGGSLEFNESTTSTVFVFLGGNQFQPLPDGDVPILIDVASADTIIPHVGAFPGETLVVAGAGDVDGDQYDDLIVGSAYHNEKRGVAGLFYGSLTFGGETLAFSRADAIMEGVVIRKAVDEEEHTIVDMAGSAVSTAGDFNGDGYSDMLIGAPSTTWARAGGTGRVFIMPGGPQI